MKNGKTRYFGFHHSSDLFAEVDQKQGHEVICPTAEAGTQLGHDQQDTHPKHSSVSSTEQVRSRTST